MLRFAKSVPYLPDPARSRPRITDEERARAAARPPEPVPFHCKPWLDGQSLGWTLFYGYLTPVTIEGAAGGRIEVENLEQLARETGQPRIVDQFAPGHFGIGSGYTLRTPEGYASLVLPANRPPPGLDLVPGLIESDWYPMQLFLVFRVPAAGTRVFVDRGMEIARVVVVPRHEGWQAEALEGEALTTLLAEQAAYQAEERQTPTRWTAASGDTFTHLYKVHAGRRQQRQAKHEAPPET